MICQVYVMKNLLLLIIVLNTDYVLATNSFAQISKENFKPTVQTLFHEFETIKNEELLVPFVNSIYKTLNYLPKFEDSKSQIKYLADGLLANISRVSNALIKIKEQIYNYNKSEIGEFRSHISSCNIGGTQVEANNSSNSLINRSLQNLIESLDSIEGSVKYAYLLSSSDVDNIKNSHTYPECSNLDHSILWKSYISHNSYTSRRIIILIEHGSDISNSRLLLSKIVAKQAISVLAPNDKFTLITIASNWTSLTVTEDCGNPNLPTILAATDNNKELMYEFIDSLSVKNERTNRNVGIKISMKMARLFNSGTKPVMLMYISGSQNFTFQETLDIMNTIAANNLSCPIVINSCAITSDNGIVPHGMQLLPDITNNYHMYTNKSRKSRGRLVIVENAKMIGLAIAKLYQYFCKNVFYERREISLPMWDSVSQTTVVSISDEIFASDQFALLGITIDFVKFAQEIIRYSSYQEHAYTILIDYSGHVLIHPTIPIATLTKSMKHTDILRFISEPNKKEIRKNLMTKWNGTIVSAKSNSTKYTWEHISGHYILILVTNGNKQSTSIPTTLSWYSNLLFDLTVGSKLCRYFDKAVTIDTASIYLSKKCFNGLLPKLNHSQTSTLLSYFQYEKYLIKNDALQDGIRNELIALIQVMVILTKKHHSSSISDYVVRRYAATRSGILQMFPGVGLSHDFDPTKRLWFLYAEQFPGKLVFTPPYLDTGGAGYIVTLAYATPYVVLGIDVTHGFIEKLLLEQNQHCTKENFTCFLVDNRGYLISHPTVMEFIENDNQPIEQLHFVHKESSVANDLLKEKDFIQKLACNDYTSGTIQRQYNLNTSYHDILTNVVIGESCVSYSIAHVNMTNIFIGIVMATCSITPTFCPCSVIDRLCLNCLRMEEKECECPCECPIQRSSCTNFTSYDDYDLCESFPELYSLEPYFIEETNEKLEECLTIDCSSKNSFETCVGVIGCEWCKIDTYGYPLKSPFCGTLNACFNGVLGAANPYKDTSNDPVSSLTSTKGTGLILGTVFGIGLLLGVAFVCWKSYHNNMRNQRMYLSARQEEQMHLSDIHLNDEYLELGNNSDKLLIDEKKASPISPYCVASNYSRPTTAADSDHGYSTMTPHDESEQLSLAPVEIDSLEDDVGSDITPPICHKTSLTTKIPHKNRIVVPVTVHRNVDAT